MLPWVTSRRRAPVRRSVAFAGNIVNPGSSAAYSILIPRFTVCVALVAASIVATTLYATGAYYSPLLLGRLARGRSAQHIDHLFDQSDRAWLVVSRLVFIADEKLFGGGGELSIWWSFFDASRARGPARLSLRAGSPDRSMVSRGFCRLRHLDASGFTDRGTLLGPTTSISQRSLIAAPAFAVLALSDSPGGLATSMVLGTIGAFTVGERMSFSPFSSRLPFGSAVPGGAAVLALGAAVVLVAFLAGYHRVPHRPRLKLLSPSSETLSATPLPFSVLRFARSRPASSGVGGVWNGGSLSNCGWRGRLGYSRVRLSTRSRAGVDGLPRRGSALVHIMMFVVVTMILTTLGRWQFGITQAFCSALRDAGPRSGRLARPTLEFFSPPIGSLRAT